MQTSIRQSLPLRALFVFRLLQIGCILSAMLIVTAAGLVRLPLADLAWPLVMMAALAGLSLIRSRMQQPLGRWELLAQLLADWFFLSVVLYFSGGGSNPFVMLYIPLLALASVLLPLRQSLIVALVCVSGYGLLNNEYVPLDLANPANGPSLHLYGMWLNFLITATVLVGLAGRLSQQLRDRDRALAQIKSESQKNQTMADVGRWSAAMAHELGSPLSTLRILASDWRQAGNDVQITAQELATLDGQITRMAVTLDRLRNNIRGEKAQGTESLFELLQRTLAEWRNQCPLQPFHLEMSDDASIASSLWLKVEAVLAILLNNAVQAQERLSPSSLSPIALKASVTPSQFELTVTNEGPALPAAVVEQLGKQPLETQGYGMGLLIARELLAPVNGQLTFSQTGLLFCARLLLPLSQQEQTP